MEIISIHFFFFVLGVLVVYHFLPHPAQNYWLLFASYTFYVIWSWKFAVLLLISTLFHYELAKYLRRENQGRPVLLWFGIAVNVLLFVIFKTSSFYLHRLETVLAQLGFQNGFGALQLVVPLGLSYLVLQQISYLIDVYRGQTRPASSPVDFALYLAYFPKMVAGPIERARSFLPILARPRLVDSDGFLRSLGLILVGLVRKLLIANLLFAYIPRDLMEKAPSTLSKVELIGWLVVYAFGFYNDFAGYTSIVRGVSGLFGIELSSNFNAPYFSRSFTEFWNRWHISLSQWLRDYIFFPVSRVLARRFPKKNAWQNLIFPSMITMLVSGFWHKPTWPMLLWGGIHGFYLVGERLVGVWRPGWLPNQQTSSLSWIRTLIVFLLVALAWVPFFMGRYHTFEFWNTLLITKTFGIINHRLIYSMVVLLLAIYLDWTQTKKVNEVFFFQYPWVTQAILLATVIMLVIIVSDMGKPFIYQGF